ncbi:translation initiation factor eIF-2B [Staphylothermus hellenicus]|uniref:Translation initiation factor eIF2B subunit delta n=1 Tax=Staphylothermus hellenicus (strain DSM 12710 / JCM 10830 / BK20S6-10-b1 / P8) TaxID=591019 RepID=D7D8U4_STAHD|nr:translation initiation factor eIF-2B [Staphylothermus hellenicus]ADI32190.1 initiation factor 2B related protein [Staphylothermus hellenicus DSM 12710]
MFKELLKHGYAKRSTGTEYAFTIINRLLNIVERGSREEFVESYKSIINSLESERPASMASWNLLREIGKYFVENGFEGLKEKILELREKYDKACWDAANIAAKRVVDGEVLMTISNSLCVRRMFKILVDEGIKYSVYVLESRPGMEGLETASYLDDLGVKTYLVVDSAARFFMKNVNRVFIGAEAIAVNGALVGKIGTSILCLTANEARVRVFAVAPLYKFSYETIHGELIELPEGDWRSLMNEEARKTLPENYNARAPIYDVTPPNYIDAIATELGLFAPQAVPVILRQVYGGFPPPIPSIEEILEKMR